MTWAVVTFIVAWVLGWTAFLQSTYYSFLKGFHSDETVQDKAAIWQLTWAFAGVLMLTYAGLVAATTLA